MNYPLHPISRTAAPAYRHMVAHRSLSNPIPDAVAQSEPQRELRAPPPVGRSGELEPLVIGVLACRGSEDVPPIGEQHV